MAGVSKRPTAVDACPHRLGIVGASGTEEGLLLPEESKAVVAGPTERDPYCSRGMAVHSHWRLSLWMDCDYETTGAAGTTIVGGCEFECQIRASARCWYRDARSTGRAVCR